MQTAPAPRRFDAGRSPTPASDLGGSPYDLDCALTCNRFYTHILV